MKSTRRTAFTLVELLVVIAIIGILVSLLVPAVQSAREAGRRLQCKNNVKQLAVAALAHHEQYGFFPSGGWGWGWTGDPDRGVGRRQPAGWNYDILPRLEQETVFLLGSDGKPDEITNQQRQGAEQRDQVSLAVFVCPTRRQPAVYPRPRGLNYVNAARCFDAGVVDYACNAGDTNARWYYGPGSMAAAENFNWNSRGALENTGVSFARSEINSGHIFDGASNTYLIGEKYLNPDNYATGWDHADDNGMYEGCAHDTYRWCRYDPAGSAHYAPRQDRMGWQNVNIFGSPHTSGVNMALCDGSVHTISFTIDPQIHARLGNRGDRQVIPAGAF